jgi:hypothetical protein
VAGETTSGGLYNGPGALVGVVSGLQGAPGGRGLKPGSGCAGDARGLALNEVVSGTPGRRMWSLLLVDCELSASAMIDFISTLIKPLNKMAMNNW